MSAYTYTPWRYEYALDEDDTEPTFDVLDARGITRAAFCTEEEAERIVAKANAA